MHASLEGGLYLHIVQYKANQGINQKSLKKAETTHSRYFKLAVYSENVKWSESEF